jgi:hypothetical protein
LLWLEAVAALLSSEVPAACLCVPLSLELVGCRAPCISLEYLANHSIDGFRGGLSVSLSAVQGTPTSGIQYILTSAVAIHIIMKNYGLNVTIVASTGCE